MRKLALVFAVGAAALIGGSAPNAADNAAKATATADGPPPSPDTTCSIWYSASRICVRDTACASPMWFMLVTVICSR